MPFLNPDTGYRQMIEEIEDYAILLLDVNGTVMNWNIGAEKIKGYKASEIIGKNFRLFYSDYDCENKLPEKLLLRASLTGKANNEGWRIRKDKTRFWGSILITAIHNENREVIGFSKVSRDLSERKTAEENEHKLRQSKEGFKLIFNASSSAIALTDVESEKFAEVNRSFLSTFGFTQDEVIGSDAAGLKIVSTKTRDTLAHNLKQNGYLKNEDILCYTKDKKEINCVLSTDSFEMEGKKYFLSIFVDISRIKAIERKAKESEEKFYKAFEANAAGIAITRLSDSTYMEVNSTFAKMTGYSKDELIGHTSLELDIIVSMTRRDEVLKQVRENASANQFELTIRNKSGRILDILSSVETILINNQKYAINTIYDITDRKKTEEQLGHLAAIVEYSDDAIVSKSLEGTISSWNRGAEIMLGYSAGEAIGKNISLIVPPEFLPDEKNILERICNDETIEHYETVRLKQNGEAVFVSITISPLKNKAGKIIGISKIIRDITERKKNEDSSKLKDAFLSIINHEIRTPLNAIMGFSDILIKGKLNDTEKEYVNIIKTAGKNLLAVISDTIDMSKIETGLMTFEENSFSPREVLQTVNVVLAEAAINKNLALVFSYDNNVPDLVAGDKNRLSQIVFNLVNNAIIFTPEGTVSVHASLVGTEPGKLLMQYSVSDTGIGISQNKLNSIFNRFKQAEDYDKRKQGGLGLGLSIARRLVELQGGTLTVESELKQGSVFSFSLPYKQVDSVRL